MSQRTIRRAAERAARKAERKLQIQPKPTQTVAVVAPEPARTTSDAQWNANRANALKSTGPITPEGRAVSSRNALKHGLTGNTVLLDSDDAEAYQSQLDAHAGEFRPVTYEERHLVQSIHDCAWRLDRILMLESAIYARGRMELDSAFAEYPPQQRKQFVSLEISERYAKQLRNLHIQEARLQRQRANDLKALAGLQARRRAEEQAAAEIIATQAPLTPKVGFDFANSQTEPMSTSAAAFQQPEMAP